MKLLFILCACVLATACAAPQFVKDGSSEAIFQQDKAQCFYEVQVSGMPPINWPVAVKTCLQARGYTVVK
jgi:hypothetical protein